MSSGVTPSGKHKSTFAERVKFRKPSCKYHVPQKKTQLGVLEPRSHTKTFLPSYFLNMLSSVPPVIWKSSLGEKPHTISDANVLSAAAHLQVTLDAT